LGLVVVGGGGGGVGGVGGGTFYVSFLTLAGSFLSENSNAIEFLIPFSNL
jgi:hypothetical protein